MQNFWSGKGCFHSATKTQLKAINSLSPLQPLQSPQLAPQLTYTVRLKPNSKPTNCPGQETVSGCLALLNGLFWSAWVEAGQRPWRGQSPVKHRGNSCPCIHQGLSQVVSSKKPVNIKYARNFHASMWSISLMPTYTLKNTTQYSVLCQNPILDFSDIKGVNWHTHRWT